VVSGFVNLKFRRPLSSDSEVPSAIQDILSKYMRIALSKSLHGSLIHTVPRLYCSPPTIARLLSRFINSYSVSRSMAARPANLEFVRDDLEELLRRRFFISRSFDIYGGVAGLYDLGVQSSLTN
jgi:hypothetical protein